METQKPKLRNWIVSQEKMQIRGSFIFLAFCVTMIILIVHGAWSDDVAARLEKMNTLIIGMGGLIGGIWKVGPVLEAKYGGKTNGETGGQ